MNWIEGLSNAIAYIEENLTEEIDIEQAAKRAYISNFYFQKSFSMLCGFTVGEYIRRRRLALAGSELMSTDDKIIDIALKYGYDSPDSFTKAFIRFHGVTPSAVRRDGALIKSFAPLKIKLTLEGGVTMNYKIVEKEAFTVMGYAKTFCYDTAHEEIPKFWKDTCIDAKEKNICGMYGVNLTDNDNAKEFEYIIADNYNPWEEIPSGIKAVTIPKHNWAVFPCNAKTIQSVNTQIFSEWLPGCKDYEIADTICIEFYDDPADYPNGLEDDNYHCEIWIPVIKK